MSVLKLLSNQGFISYNKLVARELGVYEAILLGELCSIFMQFNCNEFYFTQDKICNDTALSIKQIRCAIKTLEDKGFLTVTKKGVPCKNWYLLNKEVINNFFTNIHEGQTCNAEKSELDVPNLPNKENSNGASSEAKTDAQLNNNTSKNTEVRIHNNNSKPVAEKKVTKTESKKAESLKKQEKIQIFLSSLSEQDSFIFDKCVTSLFEFRKSQDSKFNRSSIQLTEWKYKFALFANESSRTSTEVLNTLSFALSDSWWSGCMYNPDNLIKNYDKIIFKQNKNLNKQSSSPRSYQQPRQFDENHLIF